MNNNISALLVSIAICLPFILLIFWVINLLIKNKTSDKCIRGLVDENLLLKYSRCYSDGLHIGDRMIIPVNECSCNNQQTMTVAQVENEKLILEDNINKLVSNFRHKTGCTVFDIDKEELRVSDCEPTLLYFKVSVKTGNNE